MKQVGIDDIVFEPVLGSLSTYDAKLLMCGNPTKITGFFYESHTTKRNLYVTHTLDGSKSKRVDPNFVKMIIDMFGEDSDVYRVRVAGEFPKANPDSFISLDMLNKVNNQDYKVLNIDIGVDVARFGDDESVIAVGYNKMYFDKLKTFRHNDTMKLTGEIVLIVNDLRIKYPNTRIAVHIDCDGLGVGVYDRLVEVNNEKALGIKVVECHFGGAGGKVNQNEPIEYYNSTGIMWGNMRSKFKEKTLFIPEDDVLERELTNRKYSIESDGKIRLERKEDMKKRGVNSPDRADAIALALYEPQNKVVLGYNTIL